MLVLTGDLGMGKTFLTRAICRALGVPHEVPVTSPSFALVNEYDGQLPILHADLYRLGHAEEVEQLGLRERRADSLLIVEWGLDSIAELGGQALIVDLSLDERERRLATIWAESAPELLRRAVAALT
jgi:tRNA threonylcarbamoyladenosine biosynthesis protein TsaE